MSLFIASLNSGSNGNCYYIGTEQEAVLVDAGISGREINRRMQKLGLSMDKVKAVFVSHEHADHITGLPSLVKNHRLPVYITQHTHQHCGFTLEADLAPSFQPFVPVQIGSLSITAFPKYHDAIDPHSFIITNNETTVGVFTDIGEPCQHVNHYFAHCHAAFLETNYDDDMLSRGRYPVFLKNRIRGNQGHLSNKQALDLFTAHRSPYMTHLLLSHLSKDNNSPQLVQQLFDQNSGDVHVTVASRYEASAIFEVTATGKNAVPPLKMPVKKPVQLQLSLF
ncbi:MAG: MBL fold metallo-hydrolase [Chitinophagaceae bacterium]